MANGEVHAWQADSLGYGCANVPNCASHACHPILHEVGFESVVRINSNPDYRPPFSNCLCVPSCTPEDRSPP